MFGKRRKQSKENRYNKDYLEQYILEDGDESDLSEQKNDILTNIPKSSELESTMEPEKPDIRTLDEKKEYIENCCDRIVTSNNRIDELKIEYQAVNQYLNDIHLIENMPDQQKEQLLNYAKKVIVLEKDRKDFGHSMTKLTNQQYSHMCECEDDIKDILKNMSEDEKYCETVKTDMRYLEGERLALNFERKEMKNRLYLMNGASKIGIAAFVVLTLFLMVLRFGYGANTGMLMYGLLAIAAVFILVIVLLHNKTVYEQQLTETRLNRAIYLLNKVKIKYVNVVSRLEYAYEKHGVKSAYQLNKIWGIYLKIQKEHEVYNKASNRLIEAEDGLTSLLKQMDVKDANIWIHQAYAIVERREMEETKTRLNMRRNKLKSSLDYNSESILKAQEEIKNIVLSNKEYARELAAVIDAFDI